jgi:hypothetical protein
MDDQSLEAIAELICGDNAATAPLYRSSSMLTRFFASAGLSRFQHDGSTRKWWTLNALKSCSPDELRAVIRRLASLREYRGDAKATKLALETLNRILQLEGLKVELRNAQPTIIGVPIDFDMGTDADEHELKPLPPPDFTALGLDVGVGPLLNQRWNEAQICVDRGAYLSATIAMGGLLEGLLLGVLLTRPEIANRCPAAPKDQSGTVKRFPDWTLSEMIDVAHAVGWIDLDVKRFSHALREFRNLIHPYQQLATRANPDADTCGISWLVVQAAANDLARILVGKK